MNFTLSSDFVS